MYIFCYGSNMNPDRMTARGVKYNSFEYAILQHYKLRSNKISKKIKTQAFANIEPCFEKSVFGVLFELDHNVNLLDLDKKEGYPIHYEKTIVSVLTQSGYRLALVYIATRTWTSKNDIPMSIEYKNLIYSGIDQCEKLLPDDAQLLEQFIYYKNDLKI